MTSRQTHFEKVPVKLVIKIAEILPPMTAEPDRKTRKKYSHDGVLGVGMSKGRHTNHGGK